MSCYWSQVRCDLLKLRISSNYVFRDIAFTEHFFFFDGRADREFARGAAGAVVRLADPRLPHGPGAAGLRRLTPPRARVPPPDDPGVGPQDDGWRARPRRRRRQGRDAPAPDGGPRRRSVDHRVRLHACPGRHGRLPGDGSRRVARPRSLARTGSRRSSARASGISERPRRALATLAGLRGDAPVGGGGKPLAPRSGPPATRPVRPGIARTDRRRCA